jgi:hypothetical protein
MGIGSDRPEWRPKAVESADLAAGLRAARQLQALPVPPALAKQVSNYILRAGTELASREIDPAKLLDDGRDVTGLGARTLALHPCRRGAFPGSRDGRD